MSIFEVRQQGPGEFVFTGKDTIEEETRCPIGGITSSTYRSDCLSPLLIRSFSQSGTYVMEGMSVLNGQAITTNRSRHLW